MRRMFCLIGLALVMLQLGLVEAQEKLKRSESEEKAVAKIRQLGGLALEIAQNDPRMEVSYLQKEAKFNDDYLKPLSELKGLIHLNLRNQDVTDAQLMHLKGLTSLTRLHLEKTQITDAGLPNLKALVNLEYLNLYGTGVGDPGLKNLEGMKKLRKLYLWQTKVTDAGVANLKKALPGVEIVRGLELAPVVVVPNPEKKMEKDDKKAKAKDEKKKDDKKAKAKDEVNKEEIKKKASEIKQDKKDNVEKKDKDAKKGPA